MNYRIGVETAKPGSRCKCGHVIEAHGTQGKICAACDCKQFELKGNK